ncbi:MAG: mandelate racemase/muconate lactonizing enzyme family protein [Actinobacteria bacterium]|jgi:galactonate dehydratase|uniref:Unannotated protein n=1 Tax=freshwater metagenome TaxID=449393 RepID=A0A6J6DS53_9ZZZZ|nr:mandelate racemase/muconate lactonizing enzyme family protein [Actinomycetota bacterium]MTA32662.1 mandelate racemase/muconate lactonizing enzyme family protein [Actinomycetota bacterium]
MSHTDTSKNSQVGGIPGELADRLVRDASGAKIADVTTIRSTVQPNVIQVLVTDTDGVQGLGETFYGAGVVEAQLHEVDLPLLASEQPLAVPQEVARTLQGYVGYSGSGAEVRARSALDIALWDIAAKRAGLPLRTLIRPGSPSRMPVYNTCSGALYVNQQSRQSSENWGIHAASAPTSPYEDLWAFLNRPGELALELREAGYRGMKVWPFDLAAEAARGGPNLDLTFGISVLEKIRDAVGDSMDIYLELHSLLGLEAAMRLVREVEHFDLTWVEDPIRADKVHDLAALRLVSGSPIAVGENTGSGANGYPALISNDAVDTVIVDVGWCGGVTDALGLIEASAGAGMNIAYHDCTGPASLAVAGQLSLASQNAVVQEVARAFWHTWYAQMAHGVPDIVQGQIVFDDRPGHGVELRDEFLKDSGTTLRRMSVGNG